MPAKNGTTGSCPSESANGMGLPIAFHMACTRPICFCDETMPTIVLRSRNMIRAIDQLGPSAVRRTCDNRPPGVDVASAIAVMDERRRQTHQVHRVACEYMS